MKRFLTAACLCLAAFGLTVHDAEAKRLGGGASRGIQRDSVTQRQAAPQPSAPAQQAYSSAPSTPPKRSWLGPLAGLAAGIGLGALLSHFGLGEGMADVLMILLLAMAAIFVFKLLFRRPQPQPSGDSLHFAGVGGPHMAPMPAPGSLEPVSGATAPIRPPAAIAPRNIPADFDAEGFLRVAKVNFIRLQAANDAGNLADIREFTTPEMFAEMQLDIDDRHGRSQQTDVVTLEAELLEVLTEPSRHIASVRFHGMIREEQDGAAQHFDEVWHLIKPADGSRGWVIGGIQQLN